MTAQCYKCSEIHRIPLNQTFRIDCGCGITLERKERDGIILYTPTSTLNRNPGPPKKEVLQTSNKPKSILNKAFRTVGIGMLCLVGIVALLLVLGLISNGVQSAYHSVTSNSDVLVEQVPAQQINSPAMTSYKSPNAGRLVTYSGNCTKYKRTLKNGKLLYTPIERGTGRASLDYNTKNFTFSFNERVVYSFKRFNSYNDQDNLGEGYTFGADWSAHRRNLELTFTVYQTNVGSTQDLGYEYEIVNYKTN